MLPNADPIGLPAPAWLLQSLLVLTLSLHMIPMTVTLGGTLAGLWCEAAAALSGSESHRWLARRLWSILPSVTAFTVTLGVAPLLFVQLLYGKFFYPASILTGWSWFAVVPLLLIGYGALYLQSMAKQDGRWRVWAAVAATLCFTAVGAIYISTMSLTTAPEVWKGLYAQTQAGTHWYFQLARGLHVFLGAVIMAGGTMVLIGHRAEVPAFGLSARRLGQFWASMGFILEVPASWWYLGTLSPEAAGAVPIWLPWTAVAVAFLGTAGLYVGDWLAPRPALAWVGFGGLAGAALMLAVQRHLVRQAVLAPHITAQDWKVSPQWDVFAIFAVMLLAAVGLIGYLLLRFRRDGALGPKTAARPTS